jgi:hypothetical protein
MSSRDVKRCGCGIGKGELDLISAHCTQYVNVTQILTNMNN